MASECKNHIDVVSTMEYHANRSKYVNGHDLSTINLNSKNLGFLNKLTLRLAKWLKGKDSKINEATLKKAIKDMYGTMEERDYLATKLLSLVKKNEGLKRILDHYVGLKVTKMEKLGQVKWGKPTPAGERTIDLDSLPVNVLRGAVNFLLDVIRNGNGEKIGKGLIGKIEVQFSTPRKMAYKDVTGALFDMRTAVRDFPMEQANMLARFCGADHEKQHYVTIDGKRQLRDYGMNDILNALNALALDESLSKLNMPEAKVILTDMFIRYHTKDDYGNSRLKIDDEGNMTVATSYFETDDTWKGSEDKKHSFGKYVPYEEAYVVHDKVTGDVIGNLAIPFTPEMLKKFKYESQRYKELHKNLWEFLRAEFETAQAELYDELHSLFRQDGVDWTDKEIGDLFFSESPEKYSKFKELSTDQQELVRFIHENATRYNVLKPFTFGSKHESEGRDSFPVTYDQMKFSGMWDDMIDKYEKLLGAAQRDLEAGGLSDLVEHRLTQNVGRYQSILKRAYFIRDRKDDYPIDMSTGMTLALGADTKHIEHLSQSFNVLEQRTDEGAYFQYLRHNFAMLERNKLSTMYIRSLKKSKSQPVWDYITNLYKVALYQPDSDSGFLWLKFDSDSVSKMFGRVGIKVSAAKIDRKMRQVLSFISGNLLRGHGTAVQNFTAIIQKFIDVGTERVVDAYKVLEEGGPELERIIGLSGVVDFREFFSRSLTNDARNLGGSQKQVMEITVGMINYWKSVGKIRKNDPQRQVKMNNLKRKLEKAVGKSIQSIPAESRLKQRYNIQKDMHRTNMLRKWVDYAINKEYEAANYVDNFIIRKGMSLVEVYTAFNRAHLPTMGKTETTLRALSFIIGVRAAMNKDFIPLKSLQELTPDELAQAIEIGRDYVEMMDFGMSRQDVGQIGQSNIGAFFTQFKVWSFQKMAKDLQTVEDAYRELANVDNKYFDFKAGLKMFGALMPFRNQKAMRTVSPDVAAFRTWILTQGLWTAVWDFAIMGPLLLVPGMRKITRMVPVFRSIGGSTSDLISLFLLVPGLAVALANGEGDDEWEKILDYYSRKTFFGFGARWSMDWVLGMLAFLEDADASVKAKQILNTARPLLPPPLKEVSGMALPVLEDMLD